MGYYDNIAVCKTERELLELWKTKEPVTRSYVDKKQEKTVSINHKNVFISDGIVNEAVWNHQTGRKILYLLKEAYGEDADWSLTEWLLRAKPSSSVWKRVIEWAYGIQNTTESGIAKYSPGIYEHHTELFNHIAVVNLKKSGGKSSSDYGEIEAYALADKEEIKKQLRLIAPDIILCGSTFGALNHVFDNKICPEGMQCNNWFYYTNIISDNRTLVIDYYHPANYYPALLNYYAVTNIFQQALLYQKEKEKTDMASEERILFKDKITKKEYTVLAKELLIAIDMGGDALKKILIGCENPELYSSHGTYQEGGHNLCDGLKGNRFTEKRFCKCLYYRNGKYHNPNVCRECGFADRFDITGNYRITDYEVPAHFYGKGIGEIDLIISDGKTQYATELKPYKGNTETLLRMIAEIMTYTIGYPTGKYVKAIAFFEGTKQAAEFEKAAPEIKELLTKANITVFRFEKTGEKAYQICRL